MPPTAPNIRSSDESESNISPNTPEYDGEFKDQKQARERRNKLKEGHRHRARKRKEAGDTFKAELAEYNKRKSEREAEERRVARAHRAPYDKICEAHARRTQSDLASQRGTCTTSMNSPDNGPEGT
jgi:multidrug resistance efflux pump